MSRSIDRRGEPLESPDSAAWHNEAGRPMAPGLPGLDARAELALLARILFREGYDENLAGHISAKQPDGTFLVTPYGLTWDELRASDLMRVDLENGKVLEGKWTVTVAIELHVELHRARSDIGVAVHNHPRFATVWAARHQVPPIYDQTSTMLGGPLALLDEYGGGVRETSQSQAAVRALGDAHAVLLANHGVLVVARDVRQAYLRSIAVERRCRIAWYVEALGGGTPMRDEVATVGGRMMDENGWPGSFEALARRELRRDPSVLE
jgi:L-fuculose-phosphate aldolase